MPKKQPREVQEANRLEIGLFHVGLYFKQCKQAKALWLKSGSWGWKRPILPKPLKAQLHPYSISVCGFLTKAPMGWAIKLSCSVIKTPKYRSRLNSQWPGAPQVVSRPSPCCSGVPQTSCEEAAPDLQGGDSRFSNTSALPTQTEPVRSFWRKRF